MSNFKGHCHCGATEWTATLEKDQQAHILCHCNTCKQLSGSTYTLNQIIPAKNLSFAKGGDSLGKYTYKGDSGTSRLLHTLLLHLYTSPLCPVITSSLLMLRSIPGKSVYCYYRPTCTTHVYHAQEALGPDSIVLRTGLLDEGMEKFAPAAEIYCKVRLGWEKEVAQSFDAMPPS
ncbi:carbon-sulfur lyase [Ascochyta rabiei]|uniref:Carbon-sulfur lyase n=1 Tax=Didymella rabiei TaxID=5454 RepID=A0A162ZRB9_DIDRA|nr:carbon-sulfur lyase [Ascochyta rabiei]